MDSYSILRFLLNFQLPTETRCSQSKLKRSETHLDETYKKQLIDTLLFRCFSKQITCLARNNSTKDF